MLSLQVASPGADWAHKITCSVCPLLQQLTWGRGPLPQLSMALACHMSPGQNQWVTLLGNGDTRDEPDSFCNGVDVEGLTDLI